MIKDKLHKEDWEVRKVTHSIAEELVTKYHYSHGGSNTGVYFHGLFKKNVDKCFGVAWWLPPMKPAAVASYPENWRGVLSLTRLVVLPEVPKNGASFLLGRSMQLVDREKWPCLVTYADEMMGHTGAIYKATNWKYIGKTVKTAVWLNKDGRIVCPKARRTRTVAEMKALGYKMIGRFAKHKFVHIVTKKGQ